MEEEQVTHNNCNNLPVFLYLSHSYPLKEKSILEFKFLSPNGQIATSGALYLLSKSCMNRGFSSRHYT